MLFPHFAVTLTNGCLTCAQTGENAAGAHGRELATAEMRAGVSISQCGERRESARAARRQ
jgi:hypothetical protein